MFLASLIHKTSYLCRKLTQIHITLEGKDKQHGSSCDSAQLPILTLSFSFMKMDSGGELETVDFTHTSSALGLPACSDLGVVSCVEGVWRKREAFKKDLNTRRAFHLASARFSAWWSMSLLLTNLLPGPEQFNKSRTDGSVRFGWFPVPGTQGSFYHFYTYERYFLAASSEILEHYVVATAWDKELRRKRSKYGGLCTGDF